ncbi:MAG TPA: hypothetical protein P5556_00585 [Candidatus Gastranaerophilales bacterium]|nr:hypothetical protein [Candidatus Gastranaerophilales bacterium]
MTKKNLLKIAKISGWLLLLLIIFYFISGYAMVKEYGFEHLMHKSSAWALHKYMAIPFLIFLVLHIVPYYVVRKQVKRLFAIVGIILLLSVSGAFAIDNILIKKDKPPTRQEQRKQEGKTVKCPNCPNECIIEPGEKGKCGKYENIDGKLQPVERK